MSNISVNKCVYHIHPIYDIYASDKKWKYNQYN